MYDNKKNQVKLKLAKQNLLKIKKEKDMFKSDKEKGSFSKNKKKWKDMQEI